MGSAGNGPTVPWQTQGVRSSQPFATLVNLSGRGVCVCTHVHASECVFVGLEVKSRISYLLGKSSTTELPLSARLKTLWFSLAKKLGPCCWDVIQKRRKLGSSGNWLHKIQKVVPIDTPTTPSYCRGQGQTLHAKGEGSPNSHIVQDRPAAHPR